MIPGKTVSDRNTKYITGIALVKNPMSGKLTLGFEKAEFSCINLLGQQWINYFSDGLHNCIQTFRAK